MVLVEPPMAISSHCVFERLKPYGAGQDALVVALIILFRQLDDQASGALEQLFTVGVGRQQGAVARQGEAQRFGEAVHGVGGEHAGAGAAGGAGGALDRIHFLIGGVGAGRQHHGVHQIQLVLGQLGFASLHGAAGDEDDRDVEPHGGHQHPRGDLVAVGDAHQRVGAVGVDHILHRVGDEIPARQRVEHPIVPHGDTIIHGDGVELLGHAAGLFDLAGHQLAHVLQMYMTGHELSEGVGDGDDRLVEIFIFHAGGAPQGAGARHVATGGGGLGTVLGHGAFLEIQQCKCARV
jgi:hypothetical protein